MSSSAATVVAPPPEERLPYPIVFAHASGNSGDGRDGDAVNAHTVTLFNALHWLRPVYELARWLPASSSLSADDDDKDKASPLSSSDADVRVGLQLLPHFARFYEVAERLVPQHTQPQRVVLSLRVPTPRGPRTMTRSKVEGDARAVHNTPVHATMTRTTAATATATATSLGKTTVTNSTAYFSLLPGHNQFLVHYEAAAKLACFDYVQLDMLRFAWVAVRELLDEYKVYQRDSGAITGFAMRDLRKNNGNSSSSSSTGAEEDDGGDSSSRAGARGGEAMRSAGTSASTTASAATAAVVVGRGGGNARLHQGTSGNVIVAPSAAAVQVRREAAQKRHLRAQLEEEATRRWPHTPAHKSCVFVLDEKHACELPDEVVAQLGLPPANAQTRNKTARKGPRFYRATVELPLLHKKGTPLARFVATRWWPTRVDAESDAAEVTLLALQQRYDKQQQAKAASSGA